MPPPPLTLRPIEPGDDAALARVIRTVMPQFGADGPGFAIHDPEVDHMSAAYTGPRTCYFSLVTREDVPVGGGGIAPLAGGSEDVCELRKMYFLPEARGLGWGQTLLMRCIEFARAAGYRRIYLETLERMTAAQVLYVSMGFARLEQPMGATGHFGCDRWYALEL